MSFLPKTFRRRLSSATGILVFVFLFVLMNQSTHAGPTIPGFHGTIPNITPPAPDALPQLKGIIQGVTNVVKTPEENKLEVQQSAEKAVIEWKSFDIGEQAWTHFNQQGNADWVALNRIYDKSPSQIFGRLTADGKIYLINQNGILFGPGSKVNVHSLLATSLNIGYEDFILGNLYFKADGYTAGHLWNQGSIETDDLGSVFLMAPYVENSGSIDSPFGQAVLVSGQEIEIDEGRSAVTVKAPGEEGSVAVNTWRGSLIADGGRVGIYGDFVKQEGLIRSVDAMNEGGVIRLVAKSCVRTGEGSLTKGNDILLKSEDLVEHRGILDASQRGTGEKGGGVQILGDRVGLFDSAAIDVSGDLGGGTVLLGGDFQGNNPDIPNASGTYMSPDATITANALIHGDGGRVILWADDSTRFYGTIHAKGGAEAGNGGFVETSGKRFLAALGSVDASASAGKAGTWLLDPRNVTLIQIDGAGNQSSGGSFGGGMPDVFTPSDDEALVDTDQINASLDQGTSVTINTGGTGGQEGDITVSSAIFKTSGQEATLSLEAADDIFVNATISSTSGKLNVNLSAANATPSVEDHEDNVVISESILTNGGDLVIDAAGSMVLNGRLDATDGGSVQVQAGEDLSAAKDSEIGADRVSLSSTASLIYRGVIQSPSGDVELSAGQILDLKSGSVVDVSSMYATETAAEPLEDDEIAQIEEQGLLNPGNVTLEGEVINLGGEIRAHRGKVFNELGEVSEGGYGSFTLRTDEMDALSFSSLYSKLEQWELNHDVEIEAWSGDLSIGAEETCTFDSFKMTASNGIISMDGTLIVPEMTLLGRIVNVGGRIIATRDFFQEGRITIEGADTVYTGENSLISVLVTLDNGKQHESFTLQEGIIEIKSDELIEHHGDIIIPSGKVTMAAGERVYLSEGSLIDVGGAWIDERGDANIIEAALNSNEMKDEYGQKDGPLKGEIITLNSLFGSSIGDLSGALTSEELTALERATDGGEVEIVVADGDFIMKQGAVIDMSGGGRQYDEALEAVTKVRVGNRIYDISEAPEWLYAEVFGEYIKVHRQATPQGFVEVDTEEYEGLFYGGAYSLKDYWAAHVEGGDAGQVKIIARTIALDGDIRGDVTRGFYQTEAEEPADENGNQTAGGLQEPKGGTLILGDPEGEHSIDPKQSDFVLHEVVIKDQVDALAEAFGAEDPYPIERGESTILSSENLNNAGLSNLEIYTNTKLTIEEDAQIALKAGNYQEGWKDDFGKINGRFIAIARSIEHLGEISAPSGEIQLLLKDNVTVNPGVNHVDLTEKLYLAEDSRLSAGGEIAMNAPANVSTGEEVKAAHIHGGHILLKDETSEGEGVIIQKGALVDVSGGYEINEKGQVQGGDGGVLEIAGPTIALDGELNGHALSGQNGGSIQVHTDQLVIAKAGLSLPEDFSFDTPMPEEFERDGIGLFVLGEDRLAETGFTQIDLSSSLDLVVEDDVHFIPSTARTAAPSFGSQVSQSPVHHNFIGLEENTNEGLVHVPLEDVGRTSISLHAGVEREGSSITKADREKSKVSVLSGAEIQVGPEGSIVIQGPSVGLAGTLKAPAGDVTLTANKSESQSGAETALVLEKGSRILASGTNRPASKAAVSGLVIGYTPLPGGDVRLSADQGSLKIETDVLVDISGSDPVETVIIPSDYSIDTLIVASAPGSLELTYRDELDVQGSILANARMDGLQGASLMLSRKNENAPLDMTQEVIQTFLDVGFDAMTLSSWKGLRFETPLDLSVGRALILDAPEIIGQGDDVVALSAPWVQILNLTGKYEYSGGTCTSQTAGNPTAGDVELIVSADWIDLRGNVVLSGFQDVTMSALKDMRVMDEHYEYEAAPWQGLLKSSSGLTLQANRIYPMTHMIYDWEDSNTEDRLVTAAIPSSFTFQSSNRITVLPSDGPGDAPVISAGGELILEAPEIYHMGFLCAPMGKVILQGVESDNYEAEYIEITPGSVISTSGDTAVPYGFIDGEDIWKMVDKTDATEDNGIDSLNVEMPEKGVEIRSADIMIQEGAEVDVSGGGVLFAYQFQGGLGGTSDPLRKENRYVFMPDDSVSLPGAQRVVVGNNGYTWENLEAVYLEGISGIPEGTYSLLPEEYAFLPGAMVLVDQESEMNPGESFISEQGYTVIPGYSTVEGTNTRSSLAGGFALRPAAELLEEGTFVIWEGSSGAAGNLKIEGHTIDLAKDVIKMRALDQYRGGTLEIAAENMAVGQGASLLPGQVGMTLDATLFYNLDTEEILIGNTEYTESITMADVTLRAPGVSLSCKKDITLEAGAEIHAVDDAIRLDRFLYKYEYEPGIGLSPVTPVAIREAETSGEMVGSVTRRTEQGDVLLRFHTEGGEVLWDLGDTSSESALSDQLQHEDYALISTEKYGLTSLQSTTGFITNRVGSVIHASDEVLVDGKFVPRGGNMYADNSRLTLASETIVFLKDLPENYKGELADALYLTEDIWNSLSAFETIGLRSRSDLVFLGDLSIGAEENLLIEADRVIGLLDAGSDGIVNISSGDRLRIFNSEGSSSQFDPDNHALMTLTLFDEQGEPFEEAFVINDQVILNVEASSYLALGNGDVSMDGFKEINFNALETLAFEGMGALRVDMEREPGITKSVNFNAPVMTTSYYQDDDTSYELANFKVDAAYGEIQIKGGGGSASESSVPGGVLSIHANSIHLGDETTGAMVDSPSSVIAFNAAEDIILYDGAEISARGGVREYAVGDETILDFQPGGDVFFYSAKGIIDVREGATIDVSSDVRADVIDDLDGSDLSFLAQAGALDGGNISMGAAEGGVNMAGLLMGLASKDGAGTTWGEGGSFTLDTLQLEDFSSLNSALKSGGFDHEIGIRVRSGSITVGNEDIVSAAVIKLVADTGRIDHRGTMIAGESDKGGMVEFYAGDVLQLHDESIICANASTGPGGNVVLGSGEEGNLIFDTGAFIDVSGGLNQDGGLVHFRAYRDGNTSNVSLSGKIDGAEQVNAETVFLYPTLANGSSLGNVGGYIIDPADVDVTDLDLNGGQLHVLSGIEIRGAGDLNLGSTWDLTSHRPGGEPGVLTIRAHGDLNIDQNLVDHPTDIDELPGDPGMDSWSFNLVAGADLSSADPMAVFPIDQLPQEKGKLTIADQKLVYSESGPIRFASASDTVINPGSAYGYMINSRMAYNLATFDGDISGTVGGDLILKGEQDITTLKGGAAIQSALGDVDLRVEGDLSLDVSRGTAIRTTGFSYEYQEQSLDFVTWWDAAVYFGAPYDNNELYQWSLSQQIISACGHVPGAVDEVSDTEPFIDSYGLWGAFGQPLDLDGDGQTETLRSAVNYFRNKKLLLQGDYWEYANGGDIHLKVTGSVVNRTSGLGSGNWDRGDYQEAPGIWVPSFETLTSGTGYLPTSGLATMGGGDLEIRVGGNFFSQAGTFGEGDLRVFTGGDLDGRFLVHSGDGYLNALGSFGTNRGSVLEVFDADIMLTAQGNIDLGTILNPAVTIDGMNSPSKWNLQYTIDTQVGIRAVRGDVTLLGDSPFHDTQLYREAVLPPTLEIEAGGDISLEFERYLALAPSPTGNLLLIAGRDITSLPGTYIYVSDLEPEKIYGVHHEEIEGASDLNQHALIPVHQDDPVPVEIKAGRDIQNLKLYLPKQAEIKAGRDIRNIYYSGQNINPEDITLIRAGRDLFFSTDTGAPKDFTGIDHGGPGVLLIQAGNNIDLGTTKGIQSFGNRLNPALSSEGSSLYVLAGLDKRIDLEDIDPFFDELRQAGIESGQFRQSGDVVAAQKRIEEAREAIIIPFFEGGAIGEGDIFMTSSQISTLVGTSDIFIISKGAIDVGKTTFFSEESDVKKTGIFTAGGGGINIFAQSDVNVNESRIMTYLGGDITIWSDQGDVNAGRGAKTFVKADPPRVRTKIDPETGKEIEYIEFDPPGVGSGIRTLSFDPDGEGPRQAPLPGDIFLTAPEGVIDAGEAGIAGRNLFLTATEVLNAQNIEFTGSSVGVPSVSGGAGSLGSLSGAGALSETSTLTEQTTSLASDKAQAAQEAVKSMGGMMAKWLDVRVVGFYMTVDGQKGEEKE